MNKTNIRVTVPTGLRKSIPEWRDIALKQTPNDRAVDFGHYIVATNATVRATAAKFGKFNPVGTQTVSLCNIYV
jgi:hypothetical protein